jgi:transcriptional regulator with XRE-family HTH domain
MALSDMIRLTRRREHLTLRQLGELAGTSHSTLSNYEQGHKVPTSQTLERIVEGAGWTIEASLSRRPFASADDRAKELAEVLELAAAFPARHRPHLNAPIFGR